MRRNPCDIYIYVYLVNPIIFFCNSELNQMCDVGWTHMLREHSEFFFFFPLTQMKVEHINKSVPAAAESPQAAGKKENSFTPPFSG